MSKQHILYDNFMFYKLDTDRILQMIKDQDRLIEIVKFLGVDDQKIDYIFYKRDCLFFELHRRSFTCCIYQMYAKHKVNAWLKYVEDDTRCDCCKMEYYEFNADLAKVDKGLLKLTETMSLLIASRAFEGGRTLESPFTQFVAALPATTSSSSNDSSVHGGAVYFSVTKQPIPYLDIDQDEKPKETQDSSDASSTLENQCLLSETEEKKKAEKQKPSAKTRTRATAPPSSTSSEEVVVEKPRRTLKNKLLPFAFPMPKPRKLFGASKNTEEAGPSCSYQKLHKEKRVRLTSAKTTDTSDGNSARENNPAETKTSPAWSFAWRFFRQ